MTKPPAVSIIVNNYNYGRFVGEAIESALAQTYPNVEVIVVDDGSTDNSREVIGCYEGRIIPVLKANGGQGSACNAGFAISTGDLVMFLDSDDLLEPNAIETVVREWRDDFNRMYFLLQVIGADGKPQGGTVGGVTGPSPMLGPFISGSACSGNVFSRRALEKVMPMPEGDWRIAADCYVIGTTSLFGEAKLLGRSLGKYRIHGDNNGECAEVLERARKHIHHELRLHDAFFRLTKGEVGPLERWLSRSPQHWVCRIRLFRESPHDYPWPDTLAGLTARAVKAAWRQPGRMFHQRLAYSLYAVAYGIFPRKLTRLLGKAIPLGRIFTSKSHREDADILRRAAQRSGIGART
jgi:glycosyltransferase involved in cell wall biosynthesis